MFEGEVKNFKIKGYDALIYSKVKDKNQVSLYMVQDGQMFRNIENNILEKIDVNLKDIIIVFIDSINRNDDYTPWKEDREREYDENFGGRGDEYLKFLIEDIKPYIEGRFNLKISGDRTFIAGASLGGLISLYGLFEYPEEFAGGVMVSSSFWYDNFMEYIRDKEEFNPNQIIYMDMGDSEGSGKINLYRDTLKITEDIYEILLEKEFDEENIDFIIHKGMTHNNTYFIDRIYDGIHFIESRLK